MAKQKKPSCPKCRKSHAVEPFGVSGEMFYCRSCSAHFDGVDPDEGGLHDDRNAGARMERQAHLDRIQRRAR